MSACTIDALVQQGCPANRQVGSITLNCFCGLEAGDVENAARTCEANSCPKHFQPAFDRIGWRDNICLQGFTSKYNQAGYNSCMEKFQKTRIAMPITIIIVAMIIASIVASCNDDDKWCWFLGAFFAIAGFLSLVILPPVYLAI
jgi:hypothetical protein